MKFLVTGGSGFIGTYLIDELLAKEHTVVNFDIRAPQLVHHWECWREVDVTDPVKVLAAQPKDIDCVVHLAARTDTDSDDVSEYSLNWVGTQTMVDLALRLGVSKFLSVSTQYVHETTSAPADPFDFSPFTAYGESKVLSEDVTRKKLDGSDVAYVIVRPTNIWGPRHPRYPSEFWRVLRRGLYVHPRVIPPVYRAYGYVGTVSWQVQKLAGMPAEVFPHGAVVYAGDPMVRLDDWVDAFSVALRGKAARRASPRLIRAIGRVGDLVTRARLPFPLTSSRVGNMINSSAAPMGETVELLGDSPWTLEAGVAETVDWLLATDGGASPEEPT